MSMKLSEAMDIARDLGLVHGWNQQQYADALKGIIQAEHQDIKSGERMMNKHSLPWVKSLKQSMDNHPYLSVSR